MGTPAPSAAKRQLTLDPAAKVGAQAFQSKWGSLQAKVREEQSSIIFVVIMCKVARHVDAVLVLRKTSSVTVVVAIAIGIPFCVNGITVCEITKKQQSCSIAARSNAIVSTSESVDVALITFAF